MSYENQSAVMGGINRSEGKNVRSKTTSSATVLTNWDDMIACGMHKSAVEGAYQKHFDTKPDEVHLNDDFCKTHGWLSYNQVGKVMYYDVKEVPKNKIAAERLLTNNSDTRYTHTVTMSTTELNSATTTVKNSSEISIGSSITVGAPELGIESSFSQSFTITNQRGSESTQSTSITISDTVQVTVPPHSKVKVSLVINWDERQEEFEIPVSIQQWGLTAAQFPHRVEGHYYWALSHNSFFQPPFSSKLTGSLTAAYNTSGQVVIGHAEAH